MNRMSKSDAGRGECLAQRHLSRVRGQFQQLFLATPEGEKLASHRIDRGSSLFVQFAREPVEIKAADSFVAGVCRIRAGEHFAVVGG